jgi:hypothetical protein
MGTAIGSLLKHRYDFRYRSCNSEYYEFGNFPVTRVEHAASHRIDANWCHKNEIRVHGQVDNDSN